MLPLHKNSLFDWSLDACAVAIAWVIVAAFRRSESHDDHGIFGPETAKARPDKDFEGMSDSEFHSWLLAEQPIEYPSHDLFGMASLARRISQSLNQSKPRTVSLVGPFGSGKSTVLRMARHFLRESRSARGQVIWCSLDTWGCDEKDAVVRILESAVARVAKYIDCVALSTLPSDYRNALSNTTGWLKAILSLLRERQSPEDLLRQLDDALDRADISLVIFVEDVDRNVNVEAFVSEVGSLLDRIKALDRVSFVFASGSHGGLSTVLNRISEQMEEIPAIPRAQLVY